MAITNKASYMCISRSSTIANSTEVSHISKLVTVGGGHEKGPHRAAGASRRCRRSRGRNHGRR